MSVRVIRFGSGKPRACALQIPSAEVLQAATLRICARRFAFVPEANIVLPAAAGRKKRQRLSPAFLDVRLKAKKLFAQGVFVLLFRSLHMVTDFVLSKVRPLPLIDFGYRMVAGCERLFLLDCNDPFFDRSLVSVL